MTDKELDHYLAQIQLQSLTKKTITTEERLQKELVRINKQGFSMDDEECEIGVKCVAIPLLDQKRNVIATLSVSMPTIRATKEKIKTTVQILQNATKNFHL